jgi:gluconolactonase
MSSFVSFASYHPNFKVLLGASPSIILLQENPDGLAVFHEACIYHAETESVFITSNQLALSNGQTDSSRSNKKVTVTRVYDHDDPTKITSVDATPPDLVMANGGVNYKSGLLFCAQGNRSKSFLGGIVYIARLEAPYRTQNLISTFHGRPFNSVNDVIVHPRDGKIWFTDPCYGYHQGVRPKPELPSQIYLFDARERSIRAVADDFVRPNGLCFSPDLKVLYVTDTGAVHGAEDVPFDKTGKASIYAFDILETKHGVLNFSTFRVAGSAYSCDLGPFLTNRRLFAFADTGCPDGIKCDMEGNVYSGCGDGVNIWNPGGVLIGKIFVDGGVANFCFGKRGALYICNETRLWKAQLGAHVRGALLGL